MADLRQTSSRIYVWRHGDAAAAGSIDSGNVHLAKRITVKAGPANTGSVYVYDQSRAFYLSLVASEQILMHIDDTRLVGLGASAANQAVEVYAELQSGGAW